MILEFGAKNCLSFKDWLQISFEAARKDTPSEYCFSAKEVFPWLCLEGSNASGKTNALKILYFIYNFAANSFTNEPDEDIVYDTFFNNDAKAEFYINFTLDDYKKTKNSFLYEFVLSNKKVYSEKLYLRKGTSRKKVIFDRIKNKVTDSYFDTDKKIIYRDNVSFFSTIFQYGIEKSQPFKKFFKNYFANVNYFGLTPLTYAEINRVYYEEPELFEMVKDELKHYDLGISDIKIEINKNPTATKKDKYYPVFYHYTENGDKPLLSYSQSNGTLKLFNILLFFKSVLINGGLLILDELDRDLHDDIVYDLLSKFKVDNNLNNSQIIFTSHNTLLLDEAKKYRSYFFEKENGESFCYRADEIPLSIRNDRSLSALYNNGDLGGKPKIG
jgi:hypothetical protein